MNQDRKNLQDLVAQGLLAMLLIRIILFCASIISRVVADGRLASLAADPGTIGMFFITITWTLNVVIQVLAKATDNNKQEM